MDKTSLSQIPLLTRKESYRKWALAIKGAAMWGNFWAHYTEPDFSKQVKSDEVDTTKDEDRKLEQKAQGALLMTTTMVIKLDLDQLTVKDLDDDTKSIP